MHEHTNSSACTMAQASVSVSLVALCSCVSPHAASTGSVLALCPTPLTVPLSVFLPQCRRLCDEASISPQLATAQRKSLG